MEPIQIVNAALATLALLVQRIIYPAFKDVNKIRFIDWHTWYTARIGQIVAPLMLVQLGWYAYAFWMNPTFIWQGVLLLMVVLTWLDTFIRAVPLHGKLASIIEADEREQAFQKLLSVNRPRTLLWLGIIMLEILK